MTTIQGAVLGLVQGIGEYLPISSSGHLLFVRMLLGLGDSALNADQQAAMKVLDILLHVGTLIPLAIVFWKDWLDMLRHPIKNKTLLMLIVASVPALVCYKLFDMSIFDNGWFLGIGFLITAVLLVLFDVFDRLHEQKLQAPGFPQALAMGVMQGLLGLLPGVSRSGSTMTGGMASGLSRRAAARFSFMMSAPAVLGSLLVEGYHAYRDGLFQYIDLVPTVVGIAVAAVVGYLTVRLFLRIITKVPMTYFAIYMAAIGLVYLVLQLIGSPLVPAFGLPATP